MLHLIKKPLITEKITMLNAAGVYVFEVALKASKDEVKSTIEKMFDVKVKKVRTAICLAELKRVSAATAAKKRKYKKAFVQLHDGQKISVFEGV